MHRQLFPVIKMCMKMKDRYERIVVPFSDGTKTLRVVTNLQEAYESEGKVLIDDFEKNITLAIIDDNWKDHLRKMDDLNNLFKMLLMSKRSLLIYKFEAFELFKVTMEKVNKEVLSFLFMGALPAQDYNEIAEAKDRPKRKA